MRRVFETKLWKTGNSYVVTIPLNIVKRFKLKEGKLVEIRIRDIKDI